jgi:tRNA-dihydrouridine synthase A
VIEALAAYAPAHVASGTPLRGIARHVLGLYHGRSGGRRFRQILSDAARLRDADATLLIDALAAVEPERETS